MYFADFPTLSLCCARVKHVNLYLRARTTYEIVDHAAANRVLRDSGSRRQIAAHNDRAVWVSGSRWRYRGELSNMSDNTNFQS